MCGKSSRCESRVIIPKSASQSLSIASMANIWQKLTGRRVRVIGVILIALAALTLAIQPVIRWGANYYLRNKAHLPVRMGRLFFNPATGAVSLGFKGAKPGQMLVMDLGKVRFDWWNLVMKRVRVGEVLIHNASFSVERDANGRLFVGDIELPG